MEWPRAHRLWVFGYTEDSEANGKLTLRLKHSPIEDVFTLFYAEVQDYVTPVQLDGYG